MCVRRWGKPCKFHLGDLLKFNNEKIDTVIKNSVHEYLSRQTYNNTNDINSLILDMGLKKEIFQPFYPIIDLLCNRRHKIVHEGDRIMTGDGRKFNKITSNQVEVWRGNALNFIAYVSFYSSWMEDSELALYTTKNLVY